jgi:hypothetical protein
MNKDARTALEAAALRYLATKPWEKLRDEHFFGLRDAETGLEGWASVAGNVGEEHGLGVYMGKEGRKTLEKTLSLDLDVERQNESADVIALTVADEAEASNFRAGTKLDGTAEIRGKPVFPVVFRKPSLENARALRDKEATFLARSLLAIAKTAEWGLTEDDVLDELGGRLILGLAGPTENLEIARTYEEPAAAGVVAMDAGTEQLLHEAPRTKRLVVGYQGGVLVVFDPKTKKLLHEETLAEDAASAAGERLLELLAGQGPMKALLPREIWTDAPSLETALAPALAGLGVKIQAKLDLRELRRKE